MIRVLRMHAFPWQTAGLTLIRSFQLFINFDRIAFFF